MESEDRRAARIVESGVSDPNIGVVHRRPDGCWKREPASSHRSHSIEVFPELHRSWITRDLSSAHLMSADFFAQHDFYFD